ncbi:thermonuclease family protein [Halobacillus litoralis]|uniref:TNase-like domain-containing protein n=1 Tax=Halobacillus litoralis TaxID=45668 RepID=A0A410MJ44_9BACI|nr:thermonuclease family protein [Halobacillus litoralis]QAS54752.1 hypothetical protein HLI_21075 [Halobacillus litoralis]
MKAFVLGLFLILVIVGCSSIEKEGYFKEGTQDFSTPLKAKQNNVVKENDALEATVLKIIDGDTLNIKIDNFPTDSMHQDHLYEKLANKNLTLRLIAVDAPESTKEKQRYGVVATDFVKEIVKDNPIFVELDPNADFDKYGRLLGHVYTEEGENLQSLLLTAGLARTAYLFDDYKYLNDYKKAESQAKSKELNIHSIDGYVTDSGFNMDEVDNEKEDYHINNINDIINLLDKYEIKDPLKFLPEFP